MHERRECTRETRKVTVVWCASTRTQGFTVPKAHVHPSQETTLKEDNQGREHREEATRDIHHKGKGFAFNAT